MAHRGRASVACGTAMLTTFAFGAFGAPAIAAGVDPTFAPAVPYATAPDPERVQLADLDSDGHLDMLIELRDDAPTIWWGTGDGTFEDVQVLDGTPGALTIGDFNSDTLPDLASAATPGATDNIGVLMNEGNRAFAARVAVGSIALATAINAGEVTGDDNVDLLVSTDLENPGGVHVLPGNGDGTFGEVSFVAGAGTKIGSTVLADVNNDDHEDLVAANNSEQSSELLVMYGTGEADEPFEDPVDLSGVGDIGEVTTGDLNRDGYLDVVAGSFVLGDDSGTLNVFMNTGTGGFEPVQTYESTDVLGIALGDMNSDLIPDAVTTDANAPNTVGIQLGTETGAFGNVLGYDVDAVDNIGVAVADLDGDGRTDIATAATENDLMDIMLNTTEVPEPEIASVAPASGSVDGGNAVTLAGSNLATTDRITVGGRAGTNLSIMSDSQVRFQVPAGLAAGATNVTVRTNGGTATAPNAYTYQPLTPTPVRCGKIPVRRLPKAGTVKLLNRCRTTANRPVTVTAKTLRTRGDVRVFRLFKKRGKTFITTYGVRARIRLTYSSPATARYAAYRVVRTYTV